MFGRALIAHELVHAQVAAVEGDRGLADRWPGLGLAEGASEEAVRNTLEEGGDCSTLLNFVPVEVGDVFVIAPGTVHAIGRGVLLVEPQLVMPGKTGKTYRFWDWNRRYDERGQLDPEGRPRQLHVQQSLAATDFRAPRGAPAVEALRSRPVALLETGTATLERMAALQDMRVERLRGEGVLTIPGRDALVALVVTRGRLVVLSRDDEIPFRTGESGVLPAAMGDTTVRLEGCEAILTWMAPPTGPEPSGA